MLQCLTLAMSEHRVLWTTLGGLCILAGWVGCQLSTTLIPLDPSEVSFDETNCTSVNTSQCTACPQGTFSSNDTEACVCCSSGSCLNSSDCLPCPAGYYQPLISQWTCLPCPQGHYTNTSQSVACQSCQAGYYSNQTASAVCTQCDKGFFSPYENATACEPCPRGSFCNMTGCSTCAVCPVGEEALDKGLSECSLCRPGTYKGPADHACVLCRDGEYQDRWGADRCVVCPEDHYCPSPDINPITCPEDAFCPTGSTEPTYCMETFLRKAGSSCKLSPLTIALLVICSVCLGVLAVFLIWKQISPPHAGHLRVIGPKSPLLEAQRPPRSIYGVTYDAEPVYAGW